MTTPQERRLAIFAWIAVCLIWGSEDHALNDEVKEVYPKMAATMKNVEYHVLPAIKHGYMMSLATETRPSAAL